MGDIGCRLLHVFCLSFEGGGKKIHCLTRRCGPCIVSTVGAN